MIQCDWEFARPFFILFFASDAGQTGTLRSCSLLHPLGSYSKHAGGTCAPLVGSVANSASRSGTADITAELAKPITETVV
eukprot:SAG11_NODE_32376_length_284_cov_0.702703_1_plen_79_part_01